MSTKQPRGTKRTCQSNECGVRFYDLSRHPISCPICGSVYEIASSPIAVAAATEARKPFKKPEYVIEKARPAEAVAEAEGDEVLADIEVADDATVPEAGDETFLEEEEEEGGTVTTIIGGTVPEGEEEV